MTVTIPNMSHKWSHPVFVLLCLAYFTEHDVFMAHTDSCRMYQNFTPVGDSSFFPESMCYLEDILKVDFCVIVI